MVARSPVVPYVPIGHQLPRDHAPRLGCRSNAGERSLANKTGPGVEPGPLSQWIAGFAARTSRRTLF